jgi:hypothetical protein
LKVETVIKAMVSRSELIYKEYKAALAAFGAEPFPLPAQAEGEEGIVALLDWLLSEFEGLREILVTASDNGTTLSCKSVLALLDREGCKDFMRLGSKDFVYPSYEELDQSLLSVQSVKKAFFRRF